MTIPFRDRPGPATDQQAVTTGKPSPSQLIRNLTALEQAIGLFVLPDHLLRRLARRLRPIEVAANTTVVTQGAVGDGLLLVERGSCLAAVQPEPDRLVPVAKLREGDLCGEGAVLGEPSPVSVVTETDCGLLTIDVVGLRAVVPPGGLEDAALSEQFRRRLSGQREMAARAWRDAEAPSGEAALIAVFGPKGGSGSTTIALNLAAELAKDGSGEVLVIDLDFPFTPAALLSGLVPTSSLMRASWAASLGTLAELRDELIGAAQAHPSGYLLLAGVQRIEEPELVTTEQVTTAIRALRGAFRHIVVDLGSSLTEITLNVVDQARHVVLVVTPELPSLKSGRDVLKLFRESLRIPDERLALVLNQRQAAAAVPRESVERTLGLAPVVEIRHDGARPERAALSGEALSATDPKSEVARGIHRL